MDFHIQEISQQEKFSNLHKSSLNSSKLAIGTLEKSNRLKNKNRNLTKKIINLNHSRSKTYLKNVKFSSTIPMNHNEQKNESIEYLTMNKF